MEVAELSAEDDAVIKEGLAGQGKLIVCKIQKPVLVQQVYTGMVWDYFLLWFEFTSDVEFVGFVPVL